MSRSVLRQWSGGRDPSPEQTAFARRYVLSRRLSAMGFAAAGLLTFHLLWSDGWPETLSALWFVLPGSLVAGLLLAEWAACLRRPEGGTRYATLRRRDWRDLLPRSAVAVHVALTTLALAVGVLLLVAAVPAATAWLFITTVLVGTAAVYAVVRYATVRPDPTARPGGEEPWVDAALRLRSARVALGAGSALAMLLLGGGLTWLAQAATTPPAGPATTLTRVGVLVAVCTTPLSLVAWSWIASPPRWRAAARA